MLNKRKWKTMGKKQWEKQNRAAFKKEKANGKSPLQVYEVADLKIM